VLGWNVDLGFDVGTCTTRLYQRGVGLVASEPTAVAFTTASGDVAAFGAEAKLLGEQASSGVRVVFPVRAGVVADHQATAELLRGMMRRVLGRRALFLPRALVAVNTDATPVERAALQHAVQSAGARDVRLVDGTLAGAVGAGLVATDRSARLVVGLGGGSTTFGVVAQGRLVWGRSLRFGGVDLDEAVRKLMRNRYGLAISAPTAERMKLQVAAVSPQMARTKVTLGGNEVYGELFRNLEVTLDAIPDTLARALLPVVNEIHWAIAEATTEQRAEVRANGVLLLGGTSQLQGLTQMIRDKLGVPVVRAREPAHAVALGLGAMLQDVVKLSPDGNRYGSIG
jgi:rod shape-determining protein MreB and related proteins